MEGKIRLNIRAMTFGLGILWGATVLVTGLANHIWPGYGMGFMQLLASVYPGYKASGSLGDLFAGVVYALVGGALFGLVLAWLYNRLLGSQTASPSDMKQKAGVNYQPIEPKA